MFYPAEAACEGARVASFRDPSGCLWTAGGRVFRAVRRTGLADLDAFLASETFRTFARCGSIVTTDFLDEAETTSLFGKGLLDRAFDNTEDVTVVEHERIPLASFPYEWAPEMLYAAATLTLDLMESLAAEGLGLKDATPYNVLFRGAQPVFVDLLSFERREAGDPIWAACAQFERTFLLPLLVNKHFGLSLDQVLTMRRDGLEPEDVYKLCGVWQRLRPTFLTKVAIPTWLGRRREREDARLYKPTRLNNHEQARFILGSLLKRLRRSLESVKPASGRQSAWSDYLGDNNNYTRAHFEAKERFVEDMMNELRPSRVLDVGCNTGHFSAIAARAGASVVAIDYDPVVVGAVWNKADEEGLDLLPLIVNLTRPTPATGWRNRECPSFLSRACGRFDAVLMLAVAHHMLVTERIPLAEILDLAAELTNDALLIEFVAPDDSMFRRLTRGRDHLHQDLTPELFEAECRKRFTIARSQHLENTSRWLYLLRKK